MYETTNAPPPDPRGHALRLIRCPQGRALNAVILSDDLIGTPTHYWHGRTIPCDSENCPACDAGMPWRWHGYVTVRIEPDGQRVILEITAAVAQAWADQRKTWGTLRGATVYMKRATTAPNSRVLWRLRPPDDPLADPGRDCDLTAALCIIWNLPTGALSNDGIAKDVPKIVARRNKDLTTFRPKSEPDNLGQANGKPKRKTAKK